MRDLFFQIVLLLVGVVIGVIIEILPTRSQKKRAARTIALLLIAISLVWIGYELGTREILIGATTMSTMASSTISPETTILIPTPTLTSTNTVTPKIPFITPPPTPTFIGTISVPCNSPEGFEFVVTQSGTYIFQYVSGAYSVYSTDNIPTGEASWYTTIRVFKNRSVEWDGIYMVDPDYRVADYGSFFSKNEAEEKANGHSLELFLLQGDYLILVAVDQPLGFSDNPGEVTFDVLYIPEQ